MKSSSLSFVSAVWFPVRYPAPGAVEVNGKPLIVRASLDSTIPESTEVWFSRSRIVWSSVRLVRTGMPLTDDPERLRISNSRCNVTSSSSCNRGVAFTFSPKSTYSADGYAVCPEEDDGDGMTDWMGLRVTVTVFEDWFATATSNVPSPFRSAAATATGPLPEGTVTGDANVPSPLATKRLNWLPD